MKCGNVRQLLIGGTERRWEVEDRHGIRWVTDGFVLARRDVFRIVPKSEDKPSLRKAVRNILADARAKTVVGHPVDSRRRITDNATVPVAMLLLPGSLYLAVNAACWEAWSATGLEPEVTSGGQLLWYGNVRGKRALFGLVMPMRLGPNLLGGAS